MQQKLDDIKALIKNDRRIWFGAGFFAFVLLIWGFTSKDQHRERAFRRVGDGQQYASRQIADTADPYTDLISAFRNDVEKLTKLSQGQTDKVERMSSEFERHKEQVTGVFETIVDKFEGLEKEVDELRNTQPKVAEAPIDGGAQDAQIEPDALEPIGFEEATIPPPPAPPVQKRATVISPGDSVRVLLLTGVNAPVDGTPYPVVFKLSGPITGPDGSALDIGEARLIAAAQGSEVDGRAIFRLTQLAIRHKDGRRSVADIDGWIVGEDGIRGMHGRLIDKLGRLIAATAAVSGTAALGERLLDRSSENTDPTTGLVVVGDDANFATASALTDASNRLGQVLLDRYESLVPVVEVLSGREGAAIFSKTTEIELIEEEDDGEGIYGDDAVHRVSLD